MKILKLKPEYDGLIITRNYLGLGTITFDPSKATPNQYINFSKYGFDYLFDEVEVCNNCLLQECQCITNNIELVNDENLGVEKITFIETTDPELMFITFDNDSTEENELVKKEKNTIDYDGIKQQKPRGRKKKS